MIEDVQKCFCPQQTTTTKKECMRWHLYILSDAWLVWICYGRNATKENGLREREKINNEWWTHIWLKLMIKHSCYVGKGVVQSRKCLINFAVGDFLIQYCWCCCCCCCCWTDAFDIYSEYTILLFWYIYIVIYGIDCTKWNTVW